MVVLRRLIPALRSSSSSSIDDCEPPSTSRLPVARQYSHDSGYAEYIVEDGPKAPTDACPGVDETAAGRSPTLSDDGPGSSERTASSSDTSVRRRSAPRTTPSPRRTASVSSLSSASSSRCSLSLSSSFSAAYPIAPTSPRPIFVPLPARLPPAAPAPRRSALGWRAKLAVLKRKVRPPPPKEKAQYEPTPFLRALGTQYAPSSAGVEGGGTRSAARSAWEAKVRALEGAARKESGRARERGWLSVREEEREQWWRRHTEEEGR
ncbi:hypothetical protein JCM10449v2_004416 [Rhodotorula kratochvilovae]